MDPSPVLYFLPSLWSLIFCGCEVTVQWSQGCWVELDFRPVLAFHLKYPCNVCALTWFGLIMCKVWRVCVCVSVYNWVSASKLPKHFDMSVSSGTKPVGGTEQAHAGPLQALTLLSSLSSPFLPAPPLSSHFCFLLFSSPLFSPLLSTSIHPSFLLSSGLISPLFTSSLLP